MGRLFERRPSYHALGVLLFLQLGIAAGSWALANLTQQLAGAAPAGADVASGFLERSNPDVGAHTRKALRAAVVWRVRAAAAHSARKGDREVGKVFRAFQGLESGGSWRAGSRAASMVLAVPAALQRRPHEGRCVGCGGTRVCMNLAIVTK